MPDEPMGTIVGQPWTPPRVSKVQQKTCLLGDGEGNGTPLQYSCLENPRDGGAW